MNAKILESGTHQTLDTTDTQNIQPISTRTIETLQTTSTKHDHDHDYVQIATSCEQIVTIQVEKLTTTVDSQQTQSLELFTNSPKSPQLPLIDNQLQSNVGPDAEPVITIELETPEEIPEDDTLDLSIQPQNESGNTLSSELFPEEDFPPEYFWTTDDSISSDENIIDDYYKVEPNNGTGNLWRNQNFQLNPISNFLRDTELEEDVVNGWKKVKNDEVLDLSPFTDFEGLNFSTESCNPEDFFNQLFDELMYTRMAQETNSYAHDKIRKVLQGRDHFVQMDHHTHRQHAWLGTWKYLNESDIKKIYRPSPHHVFNKEVCSAQLLVKKLFDKDTFLQNIPQ